MPYKNAGTYGKGDGYVNLCLAILLQAKRTINDPMWNDFVVEQGLQDNHNPEKIAHWVADYITAEYK
jgi:hypothetical protein